MSPRSVSDSLVRDTPILTVDDPVETAVCRLLDSDLPALPVADAKGRYAGIFGEREFFAAVFPGYLSELKYAGFVPRALEDALEKRAACGREPVRWHMNTERRPDCWVEARVRRVVGRGLGQLAQRIYQPAAIAIGLPDDTIPRALRGSLASLLIFDGLNVLEVAPQLGHKPSTCLDVYGRLFEEFDPAQRRPAVEVIREARKAVRDGALPTCYPAGRRRKIRPRAPPPKAAISRPFE